MAENDLKCHVLGNGILSDQRLVDPSIRHMTIFKERGLILFQYLGFFNIVRWSDVRFSPFFCLLSQFGSDIERIFIYQMPYYQNNFSIGIFHTLGPFAAYS